MAKATFMAITMVLTITVTRRLVTPTTTTIRTLLFQPWPPQVPMGRRAKSDQAEAAVLVLRVAVMTVAADEDDIGESEGVDRGVLVRRLLPQLAESQLPVNMNDKSKRGVREGRADVSIFMTYL